MYSYDIFITSMDDTQLCHPCGYVLYSALLKLICEKDSSISEKIHGAKISPLSISTLWNGSKIRGNMMDIPKGTQCHFTLKVIDNSISDFLNMFLLELVNKNKHIYLDNVPFVFNYINTDSKNTKVSSYENLSGNKTQYTLKFKSPTCFKNGDKMTLLPEPNLVFKGLYRKWTNFSNVSINEDIFNSMLEKIIICKLNINSRGWKFQKMTMIGFTGHVTYKLNSDVEEEIKAFNVLCNYAFYASIGAKTSHGMGQVEIIEDNL